MNVGHSLLWCWSDSEPRFVFLYYETSYKSNICTLGNNICGFGISTLESNYSRWMGTWVTYVGPHGKPITVEF